VNELEHQISEEQESITISELNHNQQKQKLNNKIDQVLSDKNNISALKQ